MFRRVVAVVMFVSFVAMATSGMMMFVMEKPSFTIQMHPVHKLFGLLMVVAALCHIYLNVRSVKNHLKERSGLIVAGVLTVALVGLYGVAANNGLPPELAEQMDAAAAQAEGAR
jgi:cytochrome b561